MRTANVIWLGLVLAACGDDKAAPPAFGFPGGRSPKDVEEKLDASIKKFREQSSRPLTAADVERFIAIYPSMKSGGGDPGATMRTIKDSGADPQEWYLIQTRVLMTYTALQMDAMKHGAIAEKDRADADVVRPYVERITAVIRPK